jgi:nicotinamidase-related amidase
VSSTVAIPGVAVCGSDLGYQVIVVEDCVAAVTDEDHRHTMEKVLPMFSTVSDSDAVMQSLLMFG